jgi:hypothetical protein
VVAVARDRVKESTTSTGSGDLTLAGAPDATFAAFSAYCANLDRVAYCILHRSLAEFETGIGTWKTGNLLQRDVVHRSSNADGAVTFSAGTKDVWIGNLAAGDEHANEVTASPAANQNDYNPTGFPSARYLKLTPTADLLITGLVGWYGRVVTLINGGTDKLLILNDNDTASTAANRFDFGKAVFLMPGDSITLRHNGTNWNRVYASLFMEDEDPMGGVHWYDEFLGGTNSAGNAGQSGLNETVSTGDSGLSTKGADATEKTLGVFSVATGASATGRVCLSWQSAGMLVPTLGPCLTLARVAVEDLSTSAEEFFFQVGFGDTFAAGDVADGVYWDYDRAVGGDFWRNSASGSSTRTKQTTNRAVTADQFDILGIFMNADWTRAAFFYSRDGKIFAFANTGTITGVNLPSVSELTAWFVKVQKTVGTGTRLGYIDWAQVHYKFKRTG